MALKLLQPGLRPMGQFDLDDDATKANVTGGELMGFAGAFSGQGAADIGAGTPEVEVGFVSTAGRAAEESGSNDRLLGFLADEGIRGYGTLFGELLGGATGKATSLSGATVIGPATHSGSDKVTLHHGPGLYGFSAPVDGTTTALGGSSDCWNTLGTISVNTAMSATSGKWLASVGSDQSHCVMVGPVTDSSLVSTTNSAAGASALNEYHAMYYLGAIGSVIDVA